jgi:hypothetical protein
MVPIGRNVFRILSVVVGSTRHVSLGQLLTLGATWADHQRWTGSSRNRTPPPSLGGGDDDHDHEEDGDRFRRRVPARYWVPDGYALPPTRLEVECDGKVDDDDDDGDDGPPRGLLGGEDWEEAAWTLRIDGPVG